jgi:hypothetical protein
MVDRTLILVRVLREFSRYDHSHQPDDVVQMFAFEANVLARGGYVAIETLTIEQTVKDGTATTLTHRFK